mmetsp:Transcript_3880/g.5091  ORF Transcript_3880/g.5091 Transcript_3880/m.5091 type:complete len:125 (-) Transcript_3880:58-432(-)
MNDDNTHSTGNPSHHQDPCKEVNAAVNECSSKNGKFSDKCTQEKLFQKRCFAELLCRSEARSFYLNKIQGSTASCSTILESFAFPENELEIPQEISNNKQIRGECRQVVHDLSKCLSQHKLGER